MKCMHGRRCCIKTGCLMNKCTHERVYLKAALPSGITIGFCADCLEAVVLSPQVVPVHKLFDHNWQITAIAERLDLNRHDLGNRITEMQAQRIKDASAEI